MEVMASGIGKILWRHDNLLGKCNILLMHILLHIGRLSCPVPTEAGFPSRFQRTLKHGNHYGVGETHLRERGIEE